VDLLETVMAFQRELDARPPVVSRCYATHAVPYGRVFRMWTTRGDLIAYVNRGEVADMPRATPAAGIAPLASFTGIPVYFE
jgi:hypothetical protein